MKIPSWWPVFLGTCIVAVSTTISTTGLLSWQPEINEKRSNLSKYRNMRELIWDMRQQGDEQETTANLFAALESGRAKKEDKLPTLFAKIAEGDLTKRYLNASLSSMKAAYESTVTTQGSGLDSLDAILAELVDKHRNIREQIRKYRKRSTRKLEGLNAKIVKEEKALTRLSKKESKMQVVWSLFGVLGFVITMCKDLPIFDPSSRNE